MAESVVLYGRIKLKSPYDFHSLTSLEINYKVQDHGKLALTGIISDEQQDRYVELVNNEDLLEVQEMDENQNTIRTLFHGFITQMRIRTVRGLYYLELEALSHTGKMDVKQTTRSFQNQTMKYNELVDNVLSGYKGSDFIDEAMGSSQLNGLVLQYMETDWKFLQRIASRNQAVLVPDSTAKAPKFWIGLPEGRQRQLEAIPYQVKRSFARAISEDPAPEWDSDSILTYTVETGQYFQLGDKVSFQEKELTVFECTAKIRDSDWVFTYKLSQESDLKPFLYTNNLLVGAALDGIILDVKKDTVRVHLNADAKQNKDQACWLPYKSFYTAEGNSGFYCMPQTGDSVQVYVPSANEKEAVVHASVRKGSSSPKLSDPGVKYWGTSSGKELKFGGNDLTLTGQENSLFIKLDNGEGITIQSHQSINLSSSKNLEITANKRMEMKAQEGIFLLCGSSSMVLDGETDIQGTELKVEGLIKLPVFVEDLEPVPEAPFADEVQPESVPADTVLGFCEAPPVKKKKKGLFSKIMDGVQLALDVAGMVPGLGIVANVANAAISAGRGDFTGALWSLAACVPFAGIAIKGAKLAKTAMNAFKLGKSIMKSSKGIGNLLESTALSGGFLGDVITAARKLGSNLTNKMLLKKLKFGMKAAIIGVLPVRRYNLENDPLGFQTAKAYFSGIGSRVVDTIMAPIELTKAVVGVHATAWTSGDPLKSYVDQGKAFFTNIIPSTKSAIVGFYKELKSGDPNAWGRATFDMLTLPIAWTKAGTVASATSRAIAASTKSMVVTTKAVAGSAKAVVVATSQAIVGTVKSIPPKITSYLETLSNPFEKLAGNNGYNFHYGDFDSKSNGSHKNTTEQQEKIDQLMGRKSEGMDKPPNRIYDESGNPLPFGFSNVKQYNDFVKSLKEELPEGTQILFQGSSVTGVSHKKGLPFDQGRKSDFDIALVNDDLFLEALEIGRGGGFKMKTDPNRIGPLDEKQLDRLELLEIIEKKSKEAGRPVSFMLYESVEQALKRPSLMVAP